MKKFKILINIFVVFCLFSSISVNGMKKLNEADTGKKTNVTINDALKARIESLSLYKEWDSLHCGNDLYADKTFFEYLFSKIFVEVEKEVEKTGTTLCEDLSKEGKLYVNVSIAKGDEYRKYIKLILEKIMSINFEFFKKIKFSHTPEDFKIFYDLIYEKLDAKYNKLAFKLFSSKNFHFFHTCRNCSNLVLVFKDEVDKTTFNEILKNEYVIKPYIEYFKHIFLLYKILCLNIDYIFYNCKDIFKIIPNDEIVEKIKYIIYILKRKEEYSLEKKPK